MGSVRQAGSSSEGSRALKTTRLVIVVLLFSSFLIFFLNRNLWDYDFWFHIATGKYIVAHGHPPDKDPFSFVSVLEENKNPLPRWERLILGEYLLSQPIFYEVFKYGGAKGIIILRSLILVLTLLIVYRRIVRSGASFAVSLGFIFLLFAVLSSATGERPVLFSFLFTALLLSLLENFSDEGGRKIFWIIPVMVLWANMHGGFIIGDIILMVYMAGEGLKALLGKSSFTKRQREIFYAASGCAILASLINPCGWDSFVVSFLPKYKILFENVQEWQSPLYFIVNKIWAVGDYRVYSYAASLLLFPLILIVRNRKLDLNHALLLSGMAFMGVRSLRLLIFYSIAFTLLMAKDFDIAVRDLIRRRSGEFVSRRAEWGTALLALVSCLLLVAGFMNDKSFRFGIADGTTVPRGAADFIEANRIEGNMLNDFSYGGYLNWRLYPWKRTFGDSRSLNIKAIKDYDFIMSAFDGASAVNGPGRVSLPLWELLLRHYKINFIVVAPLSIYGDMYPLTLKLLQGDSWIPVYCDRLSVIFVKNADLNRDLLKRHRLSSDVVYNVLIVAASSQAISSKANPRYLISLGEIFYAMGRKEDALKAYQYALNRDNDRLTRERISKIESEIREVKGSSRVFRPSLPL